MEKTVDVLIIGAGAAGLSSAYFAKKKKLNYLILEQGEKGGNSWHNMPRNIYLLSPWYVNRLPGSSLDKFSWFKQHGCVEFGTYLDNYVKEHKLNVEFNCKVSSVTTSSSGTFQVKTNKGDIEAKFIVNATGYFFKPLLPKADYVKNGSIKKMHVQQFKSAKELEQSNTFSNKKVLIVGSRISGGQTATELTKAGFDCTISARTPITFAQDPKVQKMVYIPYYIYEWILARVNPHFLENSSPPMEAGETKTLVESKAIKVKPEIVTEKNGKIQFKDGSEDSFELIIYCTGFGYIEEHLNVDKNSSRVFYMGKDQEYTSRSRYLRGIREDAKKVIKEITNQI